MLLYHALEEIYHAHKFRTLNVMYRTYSADQFIGCAVVKKRLFGFSIKGTDGHEFFLTDIIWNYKYNSNGFNGLVVWLK